MDTSKYSGGFSSNSNLLNSDPSTPSTRPQSLYGINAPDLPPRIDRQSKPGDLPVPPNNVSSNTANTPSRSNSSGGTLGRSAQERLFGKPIVSDDVQAEYISRNAANTNNPDTMERHHASLERQARMNAAVQSKISGGATAQQNGSSYDSVSSYDSYNASQLTMQNLGRLGPNAPDDLKSVPNAK